ncbi:MULTISPECIES: hypothetical protein [unclassified Coleofasciculus]|uniref:hypothetical protein n=1 Tax=unclassified Coleofasciculus TaxID=2692782 RepID=UPI001880316F|nr:MULTISPECIES: hypothetical protein [unclassified Coleofasciculus]MBE9126035.1 hypothetical protein [Coleofasciculus sp. LEGE 07081]MBE9148723.1 hypothetical protein [Coleofasciculus sp. LEGE 07092]
MGSSSPAPACALPRFGATAARRALLRRACWWGSSYRSNRSVYGSEKVEQEVSCYYLADEIRGTYRGMMIAIPPCEWKVFEQMSLMELTQVLLDLAGLVNLRAFLRHPRLEKKTNFRLKRQRPANRPHVSTAKILAQTKAKKLTP